MPFRLGVVAAFAVSFLTSFSALAEPLQLGAQGRLSSSAGGAVADGNYPMEITLHDAAVGGTPLWNELFLAVPVQGGVFALTLGAALTKLDSGVLATGKAVWVGITIGADPELTRQPLLRAPSAVHALVAAQAQDLQCSGCVGSDDLAKAAVTGEKIAIGAVGANHVNFSWAAADSAGGAANFALKANQANVADKATNADFATSAEEATTAKTAALAKGLQCTGCVGSAALATSVPADWVKGGQLAAVATSGKYTDLQGGPDLTGYGALGAANSWQKAQALTGGATLGANLDFAKSQALLFRFQNADKEPAACEKATSGLAYFDTKDSNLYYCNGSKWKALNVQQTGTATNPAASCKAILAAGDATGSGKYWLKKGDGSAFQGWCDMTAEGGGWTRILMITDTASFKSIAAVAKTTEFVDNGTYQFSMAMLKASNREVLIVETVAPFRAHLYDFKQGSNLADDNFVGAITGDVNGSVGVWNWQSSKWETMAAGKCNANNHSQWNCEPPGGVRFHYGTRDWTGDGGSSPGDGQWYFTGYADSSGGYTALNLPKYVKNWDGKFNATAHDFFVR